MRKANATWQELDRATKIRVAGYTSLAIAGAVLTGFFNVRYFQGGDVTLADYVTAGFRNSASTSFSVDLILAATAGLVLMATEGRRLGMRSTIPLMVLALVIAFAFAFPLFLALRELRQRHLPTISAQHAANQSKPS